MRGVGPAPVMSPMSKSYRKRERSKSSAAAAATTNTDAASGGNGSDTPPAKKQKVDSAGTAAAAGATTGTKKPGSRRVSLDSSSNPTFTVPKIFKVTAAENGSNSPVAANSSDNVASVSSPSPSTTTTTSKTGRPRGAPRGPRPRTKQKQQEKEQQSQERTAGAAGGAAVRRKRRPYLDVNLSEDDATRILGYRIKIWWPLDKKWYTGEVREYDSLRQSHWIIYDDNENEWIKLSEECFKLQLAPGDHFDRPGSAGNGSSFRLRANSSKESTAAVEDHSSAVVTDACSDDREENPSSRTSENAAATTNATMKATANGVTMNGTAEAAVKSFVDAVTPPVRQVYSRRKRSKPAGGGAAVGGDGGVTNGVSSAVTPDVVPSADPCEVQSPARTTSSQQGLRLDDAGAMQSERVVDEAVQASATGALPPTVVTKNGATVRKVQRKQETAGGCGDGHGNDANGIDTLYIERWPLSRHVAELLRHIEIRSRGDRGTTIGGRLLRKVWTGESPMWDVGFLFGLEIGTSTELVASSALLPVVMPVRRTPRSRSAAPSGFGTNHRVFQLRIELGSYSAVSISFVPKGCNFDSALRSSGRVEDVVLRTATRINHCPKPDEQSARLSSNLREIFKENWEELDRSGLRLSFPQSVALLSSTFVRILLSNQRLNYGPSSDPGETDSDTEKSEVELRAPQLLSMSRKGRRSPKGQKRGYVPDDGGEHPVKRVRIDEQVTVKLEDAEDGPAPQNTVLKLKRCPTQRGMWCVAETSGTEMSSVSNNEVGSDGKKRLLECSIEDDEAEDEDAGYDYLDGAELGEGWLDSGTPQKRRRRNARASETRARLAADYDPSPCTGNILIIQADRGWREQNAVVELLSDGKSWSLCVSLNTEVLYSYRVTNRINPGLSNRHTHAMMWKGGKDWMLEFTDKQQWSQFRFMHDVCCDRNARAQSVKFIPIPTVVASVAPEEAEVVPVAAQFSRPEDYIRTPSEMELALASDKVIYDMDSEDEDWLLRTNRGRGDETAVVTPDALETIVNSLEKASYQRSEEVTSEDAVEVCGSVAPPEVIKTVHSYWMEKRRNRGAPLLRCFQPPAWEEYEALLQAWQDSQKHPATRYHARPQKPQLFAFCLRPKGLEGPQRPQRQRSQRRISSRHWSSFDSSQYQYDFSDQPYFDESPSKSQTSSKSSRSTSWYTGGIRRLNHAWSVSGYRGETIADFSPSYIHLRENPTLIGTPSVDILENDRVVARQRPKPRKTPGRKPRRVIKPMSDRTFIAQPQSVVSTAAAAADAYEADSCSSMDMDIDFADQEVARKVAWARKAARIAANKAARAQELYAFADAAMSKAVTALIEAEAIAAAEREAFEAREQQILEGGADLVGFGVADGAETGSEHTQTEDDVLLPMDGSCWTAQEFGSGLIQNSSPWSGTPTSA